MSRYGFKKTSQVMGWLGALFLAAILWSQASFAARIKDIAGLEGVRENQLVGYGLVVGLEGTGDGKKSRFTIQSMGSMLERLGMTINPKDITMGNVAAVMVTADLPPFAKPGTRIDVLVSSIGDAKTLYGGTLLFAPLKGADGNIYAVAQGPVSIGGFSAGGEGGRVQKNFPTVGRVVGGALIEREVPTSFSQKRMLVLGIRNPDFTTASRMVEAINQAFKGKISFAPNSGAVNVEIPPEYREEPVSFVTALENLEITPDTIARVVINERTGTVVAGENVRISTVAIAHGNLSIEVRETKEVSQPLPFSQGQTTVTPSTELSVTEGKSQLFVVRSGTTIGDLVKGLNALGVSPRDLIVIFQAIKAAGGLNAELEVM
jgi:flagellar P-ring protein precursor FlgI